MLTLRKSVPATRPTRKKRLAAKFGKAYGNFSKNALPKTFGYLVAGLASAPPFNSQHTSDPHARRLGYSTNTGPKILPMVHINGMTEKARGWSSRCGTSSATVVLRIPTLPLLAPARDLATMAMARLWEKPNNRPSPVSSGAERVIDSDASR